MPFWQGKRVMVSGGSGFMGRRIVQRLPEKGCGRPSTYVANKALADMRV